jgi:large subunit ribosomal protein L24
MSKKFNVKTGDDVVVLAGVDRGAKGKVLSVDFENDRVVVEGINVRRKTLGRSYDRPQGGLVDKPMPIHVSNVMKEERYNQKTEKRADAPAQAEAAEVVDSASEEQEG